MAETTTLYARLPDYTGVSSSRATRIPKIAGTRRDSTAAKEGLEVRLNFGVAKAKAFPGKDNDLVTVFDCLHDMGDPAGTATHVRNSLGKNGTWMIVEPFAHDELKDNLNPVGRVYYSFSRRSQWVDAALSSICIEHVRRLALRACISFDGQPGIHKSLRSRDCRKSNDRAISPLQRAASRDRQFS
jgi:hypothetical protein